MFTRPRIIPVLLIDDRDCIKTVQFGERTYLGDVVNAVKIFNRKGIDEFSLSRVKGCGVFVKQEYLWRSDGCHEEG